MVKTRLTAGLHGQITLVISIFATLIGLTVMSDFGSTRQGTGSNAVLVIGIAIVGAIAILIMLALYLDRRFPASSFFQALLRLFTPVLVLLASTSWIINKGIFNGSERAFVQTLIIAAVLVAVTWGLIGRTPVEPRSDPPGPGAATMAVPAPILPGPPQWPDAPPTAAGEAPQSTSTQTTSTHTTSTHTTHAQPAAASDQPSQRAKRPKTHRITSGLITVVWFPLGALVLLAANWCPDEGTADSVLVLSLLYVAIQLFGNAAAGWILDHRYGNQGGALLSIGRSVLVAVILFVAVGYLLAAIAPDGPSNYCG